MAIYAACYHVRDRRQIGLGYVYLDVEAPSEESAQPIAEILGERLGVSLQYLEQKESPTS